MSAVLPIEPRWEPTLAELVAEYRAAKECQRYNAGLREDEIDAADERAYDAEQALRAALCDLGLSAVDARDMVWGVA